jgi:nitrogenase iron protein NifH
VPSPLGVSELREWASKWADHLLALETGEVRGAAAHI